MGCHHTKESRKAAYTVTRKKTCLAVAKKNYITFLEKYESKPIQRQGERYNRRVKQHLSLISRLENELFAARVHVYQLINPYNKTSRYKKSVGKYYADVIEFLEGVRV